jgi:hypothetical protein
MATRLVCRCLGLLFVLSFPFGRTAFGVSTSQPPSPISVAGFNRDVVTDANKSIRFASPVDIGTADWFEAGAIDDGGTQHFDGLVAGSLTSALTNPVTGGQTVFQLQPFNGNNALLLQYPAANTGTLSFVTPSRYRTLAILSAGYNAASNGLGSFVINFSDGSQSSPLNYNAFDWGFGQSNIAIDGRGRNFNSGGDGKAFNYNQPVPFKLFETDVDLVALGLNGHLVSSLTFSGGTISDQPGVPNHGPWTTIFAVSGVTVPEPSTSLLVLVGVVAVGLRAPLTRRGRRQTRC